MHAMRRDDVCYRCTRSGQAYIWDCGETYTGLLQPVIRGPRLYRHDDSCGLLMEKSWPAKLIAQMTSVQIRPSPSLVLVLDVMATATVGGRRRLVITRFWLIV